MESHKVVLEPIHPEAYRLTYTCLLIPRLPAHQIKDKLASDLENWLNEICAAQNWQVEFVAVNDAYLQWGLRVVSSIQMGQFMKEIRSKTSELVLSNYTDLRSADPASDFWAPGYLVVLGTRPHPKEMIKYYIRLARRQQGFKE